VQGSIYVDNEKDMQFELVTIPQKYDGTCIIAVKDTSKFEKMGAM
jgi:hypothetical protein